MNNQLKEIIEQKYGLALRHIVDAPRQFVAETYVLERDDSSKYFCKIVTKPLFIPHLVLSLPILNELHKKGLEKINYPISTVEGDLYLKLGDALVVLFNYIDAPQSENYDSFSFGQLIASIHSFTAKLNVPITKENFIYKYANTFERQLEESIISTTNDKITQSLKNLLMKYEDEIRHDYRNFQELSKRLDGRTYPMFVTHGDPGGNTLVKSHTDLYLVDWDDILLSPPERDTWFFQHIPEFINGYRSVFPGYQVNKELSHFFTYKRYFEDLVEYFSEINSDAPIEHRQKNLSGLENDCFEGWLRPAIRKFDPIK